MPEHGQDLSHKCQVLFYGTKLNKTNGVELMQAVGMGKGCGHPRGVAIPKPKPIEDIHSSHPCLSHMTGPVSLLAFRK